MAIPKYTKGCVQDVLSALDYICEMSMRARGEVAQAEQMWKHTTANREFSTVDGFMNETLRNYTGRLSLELDTLRELMHSGEGYPSTEHLSKEEVS